MNVTFSYFGQLRQFADKESESREFPDGTPLAEAIKSVVDEYGEGFSRVLLDEDGGVRPSVMVLVNDVPADKSALPELKDNDKISLLAAIAGG